MFRETLRRHLNFSVPTKVGTRSYQIPVWGGMETPGVPAPWHVGFYRTVLQGRAGVFIDGGVNLGQTLLCVKAVDGGRPYIGFEPNPRCVAYLEQLASANALEDVTVVPLGLSNATGLRRLYFPPEDSANPAATLVKNLRPNSKGHASRVIGVSTFDIARNDLEIEKVALVKVDVEGHELEVLQGMGETVARDRPPILVEVLPRAGGATPEDTEERRARLQALIRTWDYEIFVVEPGDDGTGRVRLGPFEGFRGLPWDPAISYDYLLLPTEIVGEITARF